MTDAEIRQLARDSESDRVERKESWKDANEIRAAICAFANDLPGHRSPGLVVVGQRDDGSCAGIVVDDELLLKLGGLRSESAFAPSPSTDVRALDIDGCQIAAIVIYPHATPPVRMRGRVYVRVGSRTEVARPEDERRLTERVREQAVSFDLSAPEEATLDDLLLNAIREEYLPSAIDAEVLAANDRDEIEQLKGIRFLNARGRPTFGALLAYGVDPRRWIPGAYVQFVRFAGADVTDPIRDQKELAGSIGSVLRSLDDLLKINVETELLLGESTDVKQPNYPVGALQQLVRNSLMHRAYDPKMTNASVRFYWFADRVEVNNPGGLFGQVTPENFGTGVVDYRNPLIAEIMSTLGFVQRFGIGIRIAKTELAVNGNPPPEFIFEPSFVQVIIRARA